MFNLRDQKPRRNIKELSDGLLNHREDCKRETLNPVVKLKHNKYEMCKVSDQKMSGQEFVQKTK